MAPDPQTPLRNRKSVTILLSEGSSLSARQTISALGPLGYTIDFCDSNPFCLCRFSRFVRRSFRSPSPGVDPEGYLAFVIDLLGRRHYDVLLPVHEQAFLFARVRNRLRRKTGIVLTDFDNFALLQSKALFSRLLTRLGLPQPATNLVCTKPELESVDAFPCYVKTPYGTAGQGVWRVENAAELRSVAEALDGKGLFDPGSEVVVQEVASGILSQAQAVFEDGRLAAVHCTSQLAEGMGGSQSARLSVDHPEVREHLGVLGRHLRWHGAMAVDYFYDPVRRMPLHIEANPRLVEPMNSVLSGVNLADVLVRLSLGESFHSAPMLTGRTGVRSHSLMATLLGSAGNGGSRMQLLQIVARAVLQRADFRESTEDLTPVLMDPWSLAPFGFVFLQLLKDPSVARDLARKTVSDYSLSPEAIRKIAGLTDDESPRRSDSGSS